jgi:hypothetical protein
VTWLAQCRVTSRCYTYTCSRSQRLFFTYARAASRLAGLSLAIVTGPTVPNGWVVSGLNPTYESMALQALVSHAGEEGMRIAFTVAASVHLGSQGLRLGRQPRVAEAIVSLG